jgi:hypothetical protein
MEYLIVQLCRDMHCTPSQLEQESLADVGIWLQVLSVENKVTARRERVRRRRK